MVAGELDFSMLCIRAAICYENLHPVATLSALLMVSFFARLIALVLVSVNRKQSEESDCRKF
jgi:hypothetical protein